MRHPAALSGKHCQGYRLGSLGASGQDQMRHRIGEQDAEVVKEKGNAAAHSGFGRLRSAARAGEEGPGLSRAESLFMIDFASADVSLDHSLAKMKGTIMKKPPSLTLPKLPMYFRFVIGAIVLHFCVCSHPANSKRPNILFIMSDDHTSQAISAYGGVLADVCPTPNIDRLAKEGMLFRNCFVTNSICTPSRAAIITGKYAHKNGVYKFTAMDQSQPTLPKYMQQAGYHTSLIGKYHLYSNPVGLDYFSVLPGQGRYQDPDFIVKGDESKTGKIADGKRTVFQGHSSDVIADQALDYLKHKRPNDKPFMFFCHFKAPHDRWEFAERYRDFLEDVEIPEPPNLFDDYEGRSDMLRKQLQYIGSEGGNLTNFREETEHLQGKAKKKMQYQIYMKKYLRCVKGVDDNVGRILDYLDKSGLAENTLVIYTGDQGFFLGEHGLFDKRIMYEEALRMPFLVRWPGEIRPGTTSDGMILNVDFAPTVMAIAGLPTLADMQGRSFLPLLKGDLPSDWRKSMYYRYYYSHFETESHYGVRTYQHKLIYFDRIEQWEFYDLDDDPHEMNNLYDDPEYRPIVKELKQELERLQRELGDDPNDVGDNPRLGGITPAPRYAADKDVPAGKGNISILTRLKINPDWQLP
jgi:arylsulfatase A-like enzyme